MTQNEVVAWLSGGYTSSPFWKEVYRNAQPMFVALDADGAYGGQCWDVPASFMRQFFNHIPAGNAINLPNSLPAGWTTSITPVAGCFFVKHFVASDGIDYGHTGGVIEVYDNGTMKTVEQNAGADWSLDLGSVPHEYVRNQNYGFIYLIPPEESEMKVDANNLKYLYMGIYGQDPNVAVVPNDPAIGQDYATQTEAILDYANKNGFAYWQYKPQAEAKITELTTALNKANETITALKTVHQTSNIADVIPAPQPAPVPPQTDTIHPTMTVVQPKIGLIDRAINAIFKALHIS